MAFVEKIYSSLPDDARLLRTVVFVEEQGFREEFDEIDCRATHLVIYDGDWPVATGRMFDDHGAAHIGRVAVRREYRDRHLGAAVMARLEREAASAGYTKVFLSAQCRVQGFYEKQGYHAVGETYLDEGC
ncbi:MAG: GNAT family N-acetyltransferase, partial [Acutalibacteraceae bacterium]